MYYLSIIVLNWDCSLQGIVGEGEELVGGKCRFLRFNNGNWLIEMKLSSNIALSRDTKINSKCLYTNIASSYLLATRTKFDKRLSINDVTHLEGRVDLQKSNYTTFFTQVMIYNLGYDL